jgi:NAD(P)-dependent dehydrogenase (short-subunit alcohol dehydrogenase family)
VFWSSKYGIPHLIAAGGGSVVNISSAQSVVGLSGFAAYAAAKGAINSITRTLAVENSQHNIRVNTIVVGRVIAHSKDTGVGSVPGTSHGSATPTTSPTAPPGWRRTKPGS